MPDPVNQVRPKSPPSRSSVSDALAEGWARSARKIGKGALADAMDTTPKTINRGLTGTMPEFHTVLASLLADPAALDEVFDLYGLERPRPKNASPANDMATICSLTELVSAFCKALEDGVRDHRETLTLADMARSILPALTALIDEEAAIRAA